ncbi:hypothetical protein ACOUDP_09570, partial [Acinetobacter baumannii]
MSVIDVGGEVREGEELDIGAVENWLKNQGVELVGPAVVTQYTGGASNWTYRLKLCTRQISQNPYPIRVLPS